MGVGGGGLKATQCGCEGGGGGISDARTSYPWEGGWEGGGRGRGKLGRMRRSPKTGGSSWQRDGSTENI